MPIGDDQRITIHVIQVTPSRRTAHQITLIGTPFSVSVIAGDFFGSHQDRQTDYNTFNNVLN